MQGHARVGECLETPELTFWLPMIDVNIQIRIRVKDIVSRAIAESAARDARCRDVGWKEQPAR